MEVFSHNLATSQRRTYAPTPEEYLQKSLEPANRLTNRELQQIRAIREEIESRQRLTRFEARYVRVLSIAERDFYGICLQNRKEISQVRELLKDSEKKTSPEKQAITIALLVAACSKKLREMQEHIPLNSLHLTDEQERTPAAP